MKIQFSNTCGDNYTWQKIQAMWLMGQIEGKGDIVKITGVSGNAADTIREQANDDVLADYPDVNHYFLLQKLVADRCTVCYDDFLISSYDNIDAVLEQQDMCMRVL